MRRERPRIEAETRSRLLHSIAYDLTLDFTEPSHVRSRTEIRFGVVQDGARSSSWPPDLSAS